MITRSRKEGNEEVAWNGSHIFSFATIDIEASMPGQITDVSSSTHSLSSTLNWNQAKMSVDNHTLQGEDDFEYTITADHLDSAMDYYYEEVEGGQNTLEVNNLPRNLSHILRQSGNWDKDDFDDLCASETLEKYFNGSLIPQDENVKFNIIPMEQKSLITSKIEIVTLTEREVVPKEEELDDYEDDDVEYEKEEEDEVDNLDDSQDSGPQSFFDAESENEEEDGEQRSIFDPEETADASVEPQSDTIEKSGSSNDKFKDATGNIQPPAIAQGPELNSWFLEDSDDDDDDDDDSVVPEIDRYKDETSSTRECPDLEEDIAGSGEEEEEEYDDDDDVSIVDATLEGIERYAVAPNDNIFVGTALAVNHRRPKLVNIVTTSISNSHRRHRYFTMDGSNNHSDASENYTDSRISPDRWRKRLYTTTFGRSPWTEDLTEILERLYADLEGSSTGFLLLDETLAQIVGVPLEELVEKLDSQIHALSPVASLVKQGAWANLVALSYIRSLEQSHNLEEAGEQAAENFNRLYSHLYVPLLRNQTSYGLPLPLMSEMATDLVLHRNKEPDYFNNSRKLREVAVIGLGVITPPASPPKTPA